MIIASSTFADYPPISWGISTEELSSLAWPVGQSQWQGQAAASSHQGGDR